MHPEVQLVSATLHPVLKLTLTVMNVNESFPKYYFDICVHEHAYVVENSLLIRNYLHFDDMKYNMQRPGEVASTNSGAGILRLALILKRFASEKLKRPKNAVPPALVNSYVLNLLLIRFLQDRKYLPDLHDGKIRQTAYSIHLLDTLRETKWTPDANTYY